MSHENPSIDPTLTIEKLDASSSADCNAVLSFCALRETHNLFVVGNILNNYPESNLFAAMQNGTIVGVCGYYARPKSVIPYSEDPNVVRALVHHVVSVHPHVDFLNAIGYVGRPALEEIVSLGYQPTEDPRMIFMESRLDQDVPVIAAEPLARPATDADRHELVRLLRLLQDPGNTSPVSDEIAARLSLKDRWVIEENGRLASTAFTNGLGLTAFQILAVVTHPDFRNRGYATGVCAALVRDLRRRGAKSCALFTSPENVAAQKAYSRLGFAVTDEYYMAKLVRDDQSPGNSGTPELTTPASQTRDTPRTPPRSHT